MSTQNCEFPKSNATSDEIKKILVESKNVAVVGLSRKPDRPSFDIALYLKSQGYNVTGVNPGIPDFLGEPVYKSLKDIPGPVDIVDIFRPAEAVPEIVEEAIQKKAKVIWMQSGIVNNAAADRARAAGLQVVMNKCIKVEHSMANL